MKRLLWLGLLFLSVSWLFFVQIFMVPDYNMGLIFLILGIIFSTLAFWKHDFKKPDKKYFVILIPLLLSLLVIPLPFSLGPIVLTIGILLYAIKIYIMQNENANWIFLGISFSGVVLTVQSLFIPIYSNFVAHGHRIDLLSPFASSTNNLFGLKSSISNGLIFVQTFEKTYPFTTTWEKLGFFPWFNILIGAMLLFFFIPNFRKIGKYVLGFLLLSLVYLILRYVMIMFIFTHTNNITLLWEPILLIISFIPLALLLMRFAPLKSLDFRLDCFKDFKLNKKRIITVILVFLFVFSFVGAFVFQDPGTEKQGRILIDEVHSEWEDTSEKLDVDWYGMLSTYNYYCWADWLDKYYTVDIFDNTTNYNLHSADNDKLIDGGEYPIITSELLSNYDILVLKCPTEMYYEEEIDAIVDFVESGGGLYLIGDHTNVFGMNFYLNLVSEQFGITFNTDANYELGTGRTSGYTPDTIFPHVVMQNVEQFDFLTSCTLKTPITSENVIIGNLVFGEPGTYSTENFFRESTGSPDLEYGLLLQVAALKYGKGRILAFTDSTCFSNFCIFMDGYQNFNLGTIEYLNRVNTYNYLNTVFAAIAVISLLLTTFLLKKERKTMIVFLFITVGMLSFSIATPIFSSINNSSYELPSAHADYNKVCFEEEYSDTIIVHLPSFGFYETNKLYGTFYVWTQRVNCIPSIEKTLDDALNKGDAVVIINPVKSFEQEDIDAITDYIENGGSILLMDGALNTGSTSNELLQGFDITLQYESSTNRIFHYSNTTNDLIFGNETQNDSVLSNLSIGNMSIPHLNIQGGEDVFVTENNETYIAVVERGEGRLVVVIDSYAFNDNVLGGTFTEPDENLRRIYNTQYYIFEEILQLK